MPEKQRSEKQSMVLKRQNIGLVPPIYFIFPSHLFSSQNNKKCFFILFFQFLVTM